MPAVFTILLPIAELFTAGDVGIENLMSAKRMTRSVLDAIETMMKTTKGDEGIDTEKRNLMRSERNVESGGGKTRLKRKGRNVDAGERRERETETVAEIDLKMKARGDDIGPDAKDPFRGSLTDLNGRIDLTGLPRGTSIWTASV
jgi:hypothetical protein